MHDANKRQKYLNPDLISEKQIRAERKSYKSKILNKKLVELQSWFSANCTQLLIITII